MPKFDEEKQKKRFKELREKEAEDLAKILAKKYGIRYLDLSRITIDLDSLKILPEAEARAGELAVFQSVGKKLQVAARNPELPKTKQILEELKSKRFEPELFLVSEISLEKAFSRYSEVPAFVEVSSGIIDISPERLEKFQSRISGVGGLRELLRQATAEREARKISEILEMILAGALALDASDVHIEPGEARTLLRYRLDGVLQDLIPIPNKVYQLLLSRIKLVSELKLNVKSEAQDGRFTIRTREADMEVRTSSLPGPYGESLVLRVLNPKTIGMTFENLGIEPGLLDALASELKKPNGMILTTGPTGSGKTTTLYAFVKKIQTPGIKIVTIEDPIEYHIQGITQTQVDSEKGYDFASGLRSILRQDPDVIMVGEIRDLETAQTAMHSALTGHLVFSTLHTNDAAGTIPRLIDLGVKPNIIAPSINVAMAQRLVRKLCAKCAQKEKPSQAELKMIETEIANLPPKTKKPDLKNILVPKPAGCETCNGTGYKGRIGVFEAFFVNDQIERLILKDPSGAAIKEAARAQGMLTMKQDGILKVLGGVTSLEELERVVGE
ncbi:MAG: GspE/PulE family protein [bacterium]|nr:GspE/PulE family protein [bacterium]